MKWIRMCVLILVALLFYGISCDEVVQSSCQNDNYCVRLSEETSAEAGLCAVIPCGFTAALHVKHLMWYKCATASKIYCDSSDQLIFNSSSRVQPEFEGRVSLLAPDLELKNCSIIISDVRKSDSGLYQLRVSGYSNEKWDAFTFVSKTKLTVTGLSQKPTLTVPSLTAGQQSTLTCSAPGLCSGSAPTFTWSLRKPGGRSSPITGNITVNAKKVNDVAQRHSSALTFNLSAEHHDTEVTCKVDFTGNITTEETVKLNVSYFKKAKISGNSTLNVGDTLNLTCRVDSSPPSYITWTKSGSDSLPEETQGAFVSIIIYNTTTEASGEYVCTAKHPVNNATKHSTVNVTFLPQILNGSGCANQRDVLTCVCVSEGVPLPTITWLLLEDHTAYSASSTALKRTVHSNITLQLSAQSISFVKCVSRNLNGETSEFLTITTHLKQEDATIKRFLNSWWLQVAVGVFIGVFLSVAVVCLSRRCHRDKHKKSENAVKTMEMRTQQTVLEADAGQSDETHCSDVTYSAIDFSKLKRKDTKTRATPETEYAEVKRGRRGRERLEGNEGGGGAVFRCS